MRTNRNMNGNTIHQTIMALVAVSFTLTSACLAQSDLKDDPAYLDIDGAINLTEMQGKNGPFTPAAFYHKFTLGTAVESSGDNDWFGWTIHHDGINDDMYTIGKAKALKIAFDEGKAEVVAEGDKG